MFTNQIDVITNGTNIKFTTTLFVKNYGVSIYAEVQNKIIDITEDLCVDLPFTQVSSSELQLQRLQLELERNNIKNKIDVLNTETVKNNVGIITDTASFLTSFIGGVVSGNAGASISAVNNLISSPIQRALNNVEIEKNINYANERLSLINKKVYSSSKLMSNKFSYINALCGLCVLKINPDNNEQIDKTINLSGYVVRELVGDIIQELDIINISPKYEVLKFDEVNIYGVISQQYANNIEKILQSGIRIWFKNEIEDLV